MVSNLISGNAKPRSGVNELQDRQRNPFTRIYVTYIGRGSSSKWQYGSYVAVFLLAILASLVVLLPLMNRINSLALRSINRKEVPCGDKCRIELVESIPEGVVFDTHVNNSLTPNVWKLFIENAQETIEIASFYWSLKGDEKYPSSKPGDDIYKALIDAGLKRNITIRIAQNDPSTFQPNPDTEYLAEIKAAQVRSVNVEKLMKAGVLHTKFWIVDRKHVYIGSANMDWKSLTQVKELGTAVYDCPCIAEDLAKVFEVYWELGEAESIPKTWPEKYSTKYNLNTPLNVNFSNKTNLVYISSAPPKFSPKGRTDDIDALLKTIANAKKFIHIAVMNYFPMTVYSPKDKFWPIIDDALRRAIIDRGVNVKILISHWKNTRPMIYNFMNSLKSLNRFNKKVTVEVKKFHITSTPEQEKIPYARVNHNKYMVTDNGVFIGTSNWSGDYFIDTAGVSFVMTTNNSTDNTIRENLVSVFERDWTSKYAHDIF